MSAIIPIPPLSWAFPLVCSLSACRQEQAAKQQSRAGEALLGSLLRNNPGLEGVGQLLIAFSETAGSFQGCWKALKRKTGKVPRPAGPTLGCIAMDKEAVVRLIRWLDPALSPRFAMGDYGGLKSLRIMN